MTFCFTKSLQLLVLSLRDIVIKLMGRYWTTFCFIFRQIIYCFVIFCWYRSIYDILPINISKFSITVQDHSTDIQSNRLLSSIDHLSFNISVIFQQSLRNPLSIFQAFYCYLLSISLIRFFYFLISSSM